jgi:hypothetical protein
MPNQRRSIRDIPLTPKQRTEEDALKWKEEPAVPQLRRDVEEVPDMAEELLREEKPLDHATEVAHIDIKAKPVSTRKIKISDGTRLRTKAPRYDIEPAFISSDVDTDTSTQTKEFASKKPASIGDKNTWLKRGVVGTALVVIVLFLLLSFVFNRASIAIKGANTVETFSNTALPTPVTYTALTKNIEKSITVSKPKTISVQKKATGEVVLYNNFSTSPYELIATTRLETANGSVYRLLSDTKIPGKKTVNGKDTPGSITVKVEADLPGDIYNARPGIELRIPGLIKGTGKYVNIYGKTANQFKGGETGQALDTSSDQITAAINTLKAEVEGEMIREFNQSNPELFILSDSIQVSHAIGAMSDKDGSSQIKIPLTIKAIGLQKSELSSAIDAHLLTKRVKVGNSTYENIKFTVSKTDDNTLLKDKFNILADGQITVSPLISEQEIIANIAGKPSTFAFDYLDSNLTEGSEIKVNVWPFWKNKIPNNPAKIELIFE